MRRYAQSNLVVALLCGLVFFILLRDGLSLTEREIAAAVLLGCWQVGFLLCVLTRRRRPWLWPTARTSAVVLFVGWQLFFLFARNPLDFWYTPIRDWCVKQQVWDRGVGSMLDPVNNAADRYANFNGIDQNWKMFTPPLARSDAFLAARLEFTDSTQDVLLSDNEPDPRGFFRFGGWRQRRLEDILVYKTGSRLADDPDLPLCEAYARWSIHRWRERHQDDPRTLLRVVFLRREVAFPAPGTDPNVFAPAVVSPIAVFLPDGSLAP
jgi:hypothetical protein